MNGISDNVSRMLNHLDFFRAMSHAIGIPAIRSMADTNNAIVKLFVIALRARFLSDASLRTTWIEPQLMAIPSIGGSRIKEKKRTIAIKYTEYFMVLLDDAASRASVILFLSKFSLFHLATYIDSS